MPKDRIAVVTKDAANYPALMAMVDMPVFAIRVWRLAGTAGAALFIEQLIESFERNSISAFQMNSPQTLRIIRRHSSFLWMRTQEVADVLPRTLHAPATFAITQSSGATLARLAGDMFLSTDGPENARIFPLGLPENLGFDGMHAPS
jgi:hypothetical protein